jgi:hypothetical protein
VGDADRSDGALRADRVAIVCGAKKKRKIKN